MNERIPVTIFTGLLGAGKTTILSNLIKTAKGRRFAILVNEFGEVSIDDAILKAHADPEAMEFHSFTHGLLAYGGDERFSQIMETLLDRSYSIDHVLVETSGLAVPSAMIEALQSPPLKDYFILDATLVIVDSANFLSRKVRKDLRAQNGLGVQKDFRVPTDLSEESLSMVTSLTEVFRQQLECADVVVLNKIDDLSPDDLLEAECMIRTQSPSIRFIELAYHAQLDERLVLGLRLNEARFLDRTYRFASKTSTNVLHQHRDVHDHSGLGPHEHGVMTHEHLHEHDSGWMSFVLHSHERQDSTELRTALVDITNTEQVLRIKGTVLLHGLEQPVLVQGVRSRIDIVAEEPVLTVHGRHPIRHDVQNVDHSHAHAHDPDHEHGNETGHYSQLIFIGYHLDRNKVVDMLNKHTRTHWQ